MSSITEKNTTGMAADVVVIGAGIVGVSAAINLQRKGLSVIIIDGREPSERASFGNAGIIAPCAIVPVPVPGMLKKLPGMWMDPMGPLSIDPLHVLRHPKWFLDYLRHGSKNEVKRIASELAKLTVNAAEEHITLAKNTKADGLMKRSDYFYVYQDRRNFLAEAFAWNIRAQNGIEFYEVPESELRELEPDLSEQFKFAVRLPGHGFSLNPGQLIEGLCNSFQENGGTLLQANAKGFERGADGVNAIITSSGKIGFGKLVIAAGAWSAELVKQLGVNIPLMSERGYHVEFQNTGIQQNNPLMITTGKYVATPMQDRLRLAGIVEFRSMSAKANPKLWQRLKRHAKILFPTANLDEMTTWMGHRPSLPDSLPVIGPLRDHPNILLAFGHQHIGLTTGPKTGRLISQMITNETPNENLDAFHPSRFSEGRG